MRRNDGALSLATRARLVQQAFRRTAAYDAAIFEYLGSNLAWANPGTEGTGESFVVQEVLKTDPDIGDAAAVNDSPLFSAGEFNLYKKFSLRYGENPHQAAALYDTAEDGGVGNAEVLSGKEMSFNNYVDADAAWQLVCDFDEMACAIIKHTNPAGVGTALEPKGLTAAHSPPTRFRPSAASSPLIGRLTRGRPAP